MRAFGVSCRKHPAALEQLLLEGFGARLAGAWPTDCHVRVTIPDDWNLYLPWASRAILKKMNPSLKRGIMQIQTLVCSRRP